MTASKLALFFAILHMPSYGGYRFHPGHFSPSMMGRMLGFGGKVLLQGLAGQLGKRSDAVLIGIFLGPQKIVFFNLAHMLLDRTASLTQIASHAFMPAFSSMHADGDQQRMERYFFTGTKYIYGLQVASCMGIGVVGAAFINLWIGPEYGEAARPLIWILVASALIGGALPLHNRFLMALDRHGWLAILYSARALLNVALTIALIPLFGLIGAALATLMARIVITPFVWRAVFRHMTVTPLHYLRTSLGPVLLAGVFMAVVTALSAHVVGMDSWAALLLTVAIGAVAFPLLFLLLATSGEDRMFLRSLWRRAFPPE